MPPAEINDDSVLDRFVLAIRRDLGHEAGEPSRDLRCRIESQQQAMLRYARACTSR
jgi:hypothetical protein